jgi:arabinofuranan 3-O-arabinosyltransferase
VPEIPTVDELGSVATVDVPTGPSSSRVVRISIASERAVTTKEYFSGGQRILPIAIAEFGLPTRVGATPSTLPSLCRTDLLNLDGQPQGFTFEGTVTDAIARSPLALVPCGSATSYASRLDVGDHRLETAKGLDTGIDIDSVELQSIPVTPATAATNVPVTSATETGTNSYSVTIENSTVPFWLVLGQSLSEGWSATVRGGSSLGSPTLIDGYANGWLIDPAVTGSTFTVDITWAPQKFVWTGLAVSAPWFIGLCAAAVVLTRRRRRGVNSHAEATDPVLVASSTSHSVTIAERLGLVAIVASVAAIVGGLGVALAMAAVSALLVWNRRRSVMAALTVLVSIGGIVVLYTGLQVRREFSNGVEWPAGFWFAHQLGLVAVLTVAAETLIRWFLRTRSKSTQSASDANQINDGSTLTR